MAPNTVAAIPLEEERPPFPLGMTAWCSFLCWTVATEAADRTAGEQLPIERRGTQAAFDPRQEVRHTQLPLYYLGTPC